MSTKYNVHLQIEQLDRNELLYNSHGDNYEHQRNYQELNIPQPKSQQPNNQQTTNRQPNHPNDQCPNNAQPNNQQQTDLLVAQVNDTRSEETAQPVRLNRLEKVLHSFGEGKAIYRHVHLHGKLDDETRKILVRMIIQSEIDEACQGLSVIGTEKLDEFVITKKRFTEYAEQIQNLFPPDLKEIYYTPYYSNNGNKVLASGRLWDHYNYAKGCMRDHGLLKRKCERKSPTPVAVNSSDEIKEKLERLKTFSEPLVRVIDDWRETFAARQRMLHVEKIDVSTYFSKFLPLRLQCGVHLINSDFEALHAGKTDFLTRRWSIGAEQLILRLQLLKNIRSVEDKALVKVLPRLDTGPKTAAIFHLLHYLIPAERQGRKRKSSNVESNAKSSMNDRRESFTIIVPTTADIESDLEKRRDELRKKGETLQPTPVIFGTITDIISTHVVVNDIIYKTDSYVNAIDLCFKIFYAANCEFPAGSKNIWKVIQKAFFEIESTTDRFCPAVNALTGELWAAFELGQN